MKKRGDLTITALFEVLIAIFGVFLLIYVASLYGNGEAYGMVYNAKQLALQIDALNAVPGDAYFFHNRLSDYTIHFHEGRVDVYQGEYHGGQDVYKGTYHFTKKSKQQIDGKFIKPNHLFIAKINDEIIISEEMPNVKTE